MSEIDTSTTAGKVEVMQAFIAGATVQYKENKPWEEHWQTFEQVTSNHQPIWDWLRMTYRIKPAEPDSIEWSHVAPNFKFMAREADGKTFLYSERPHCENRLCWTVKDGHIAYAAPFVSYRDNGTPWRDSLVVRPEGA